MTQNISEGTAIVVYGASSENIKQDYKNAAYEAGQLIARSGHALVCGGGRQGLMRAAIDGALSEGGEAIGVLPEFMVKNGWQHPGLTKMISTASMHERKQTMARMAMAAIACPGGCGTFEELLELITWRQLNLYRGQVVILNVDGYYNPLLEMFDRAIEQGFMHADHRKLYTVASTAAEAVEAALTPVDPHTFSQKIH
ncbi:MAG: TIGR00730 family Rossman fold protein [Firmicutes bacterium]|nr:TIGR00730 family Rossman fold protein [Bacillota bacterium]MCM1400558.1 TIGR00730 family Rossman fold protein [Bacteroides sp.]MCM1476462.1 TIGR00730 family Rossman fold protein [Bacteroides sp.]